ncbi:hypothetical protein FYJ74_07260 [Pyramidobacter sp. SM-530-WT-4B]|uniref:Uncharacterized protein n=1 Tax=Pyramidobacter porci TaxID=2605789 RepID=A0A6L5YBW3_9BACT|nr:hypothetical protein [Pyramidobacter porci]MST55826.1 hypothetical protein [Pyramidobacter porci]
MTPVDVGMIFIIIHHIAASRLFADFPRSIFAQFLQKMQFLHFIAVALFYRIVPALAPELGKERGNLRRAGLRPHVVSYADQRRGNAGLARDRAAKSVRHAISYNSRRLFGALKRAKNLCPF